MSRRHKNNHYRYAEKFDKKNRRLRVSDILKAPKKAFTLALLALLAFGLISTTFAAYVSSDDFTENSGSILVNVRNTRAMREGPAGYEDLAPVGADMDMAGTSYTSATASNNLSTSSTENKIVFFFNDVNGSVVLEYRGGSTSGYSTQSTADSHTYFSVPSASTYAGLHYYNNGTWGDWYNTSGNLDLTKQNKVVLKQGGSWYQENGTYTLTPTVNTTLSSTYVQSGSSVTVNYSLSNYSSFITVDSVKYTFANESADLTEGTDFTTSFSGSACTFTPYTSGNYTVKATITYHMKGFKGVSGLSGLTASSGDKSLSVGYRGGSRHVLKIANWDLSGVTERYAAYLFGENSNTTWINAVSCADSGYVYIDIPAVTSASTCYSKLIWCRMNGGNNTNNFDNRWNQTGDIVYKNGKNLCTPAGTSATTVTYTMGTHTHKYYAYEVTRNTSSGSYGTPVRTISPGTDLDCDDSTISLTATNRTASGYKFDGWFRGTSSGPANATTRVSTDYSYSAPNYTGNSYYYAKYTLSSFTVSYAGFGDSFTDTDSETVYYGNTPADVPNTDVDGYSFRYWKRTGDASTQYSSADIEGYSITANQTFTAYYDIDAPTVTISDTQHTANGASTTLSHSVTSQASGISPTKSFTIINGPTGAILPGNAGANCAIDANGAFTAAIPGEYTIQLIGTVSNASTLNGTASSTATCIVRVVPAKPSFTISLSGASGDGGGTFTEPFKILTGATYTFSAAVDSPISGYSYYWSLTGEDGSWNSFPVSADTDDPYQTPTFSSTTTPVTVNGNDTITFHSVFANTSKNKTKFKLYMKTEMNGMTAQADAVEIYYFIEPLIETFEFMPKQKIYNSTFENTRINVQYNLQNAAGYTTTMYFSNDNGSYRPIQRKSDTFIASFENTLKRFFYPEGVKYFKMGITKGTPGTAEYLESYLMLHTTVGTAEFNGVRPFYFINNVYENGDRLDLTNKRVVAYWSDPSKASGYSYQTAQDVYKDEQGRSPGVRYRVNLPSNATDLLFVVEDKDHYGKPQFSNGVFSFSNPDAETTLFYAITDHIALDDENCYTVDSSSGSGIVQLSGDVSFYEAE